MRVLITAGAHFAITRDGALWIQNASMGYALWARYLEVFDEVRLLVRARPHAELSEGWTRASGPGVTVVPVPDSVGPWGFAKDYARITVAFGRRWRGRSGPATGSVPHRR